MRLLFCLSLLLALIAQYNAQAGETRPLPSGTQLVDSTLAVPQVARKAATVVAHEADRKHCLHIPCSSSTHDHTNAGCAGHAFGIDQASPTAVYASIRQRVVAQDDAVIGLTFPPPVRPPLA
jgi:hypothetical protein